MSYRDSKAVHRAMAVGPAIMAVITLGFLTMGLVSHLYRPGLEVGDMALPLTLLDVLPDGVAGVLFAAPLAAIMSTVDSMILVVSGVIVRDLFKTYVKPDLSDHAGSRMGTMVSAVSDHRDRARLQAAGVLGVPHHLRHRRSRGPALRADRRRALLAAGQRTGRRIGDGRRRKPYVVANEWVPDLTLGMFPIATASAVAFALYLSALRSGHPRAMRCW